MKLSVPERLVALSVLPREGGFVTLKIIQNLRLSLSFSEAELKEWGIASDEQNKRTTWKVNGEADIPIGEKGMDIMADALRKLNEEKKLTDQMLDLYEKFIPSK